MSRPPPLPRKRLPRIVAVVGATGVAATAVVAVIYVARTRIVADSAVAWLRARGVDAQVRLVRLTPGVMTGSLRVGRPEAPDLTVGQVELHYSLQSLLAGRGPQLASVRLGRTVLRARLHDGRLTLGQVDRLIAALRQPPGRPGAPPPRIELADGQVALATDYGPLSARANAVVDEGHLLDLRVDLAPARLKAGDAALELDSARANARRRGDRLLVDLTARASAARTPEAEATGAALTLSADLAYPALEHGQARGRVSWTLDVASARAKHAEAAGLRLAGQSADLRATVGAAAIALAADLRLAAQAQRLSADKLRLTDTTAEGAGKVELAPAGIAFDLTGAARGAGAWSGLGAPTADETPSLAAIKRAARGFRWRVERAAVAQGPKGLSVKLLGPARLKAPGGARADLTPSASGYRLRTAGGGLPAVDAEASRFALVSGGAEARGRIRAALSIGPVEEAEVDAAGRLLLKDGTARLLGERCATASARRLVLGENDARTLAGRLCPAGEPLMTLGAGGWSIAGRAENVSGEVPFLAARLREGAGQVRLGMRGQAFSAQAAIAAVTVTDATQPARYKPLVMSGEAQADRDLWTGSLDFRLPGRPQPIAHGVLRHDGEAGVGQLQVTTGPLAFSPGGLQPSDLSSLGSDLVEAVQATATFDGGFQWAAGKTTSGGTLTIASASLKTPFGGVTGLGGTVRFTSLSPLVGASAGPLHAQAIASAVPLADVSAASADLTEDGLAVTDIAATVGGGRLQAQAVRIPFAAASPVTAEMIVDGVQVHDLVEGSPFGDRVDLTAKLSGRIPFRVQDGKVRIMGGSLRAEGPGRLSINRAALSSTAPAAEAAEPNAISDFAYQAMENLAFDALDARIDSRPDGRLGVLFHLKGRHDPPQHQEIEVTWLELIQRRFLNKRLPLPSDTAIDLTLDTTLNLDQLIEDFGALRRRDDSASVQAAPPTVDGKPGEIRP